MQTVIEGHALRAGMAVVVTSWQGQTVDAEVLEATPQHNDLGARWTVVALRIDGSTYHFVDSRLHLFLTPDRTVTAWCPQCRTARDVVDDFPDSVHTRDGEQTYRVQVLSCDHQLEARGPIVLPSPGAPFAGPQTPVAASTRTRDLLATDAAVARREARDQNL